MYEGSLRAGMFHDFGIFTYGRSGHDGGSYAGNYRGGLRHGRGKRVFSNGNVYGGYSGQTALASAKKCGDLLFSGTSTEPHKPHRADGDFFQNYMSGEGTMTYVSGDVYVGDWKFDRPNGNGVITYGYGDRCEFGSAARGGVGVGGGGGGHCCCCCCY